MSKLTIEMDGYLSCNMRVKVDDDPIGLIQSIDVGASVEDIISYVRIVMIDPDTYPKESPLYNSQLKTIEKLRSLNFVHLVLKPLEYFKHPTYGKIEKRELVKDNSFDVSTAQIEGNEVKYDEKDPEEPKK